LKILRIAAIVVGVVAFAASVVATGGATLALAPEIIAAATTIATIATLASIAIGVVSLAVGSKPRSSVTGSPTQFKLDPQAPKPYMIGRTFNAGYVVHRDTYGTDNQFESFVIVWSGAGPVEAIEAFTVDNAAITFGGDAAAGDYSGWMWLDTQVGACPESSALVASQGSFPGWGSSSKLSGIAAGLWTLKFDKKGKHYQGGVPQPGAVIQGVKVYDPRLDSTYPGGSGSCRALDEATYVYSENPWLHALTFALGRFQNGKRVMGVGMPIASIDVAAFVEAANIADANEWKAGGTVSSADDKWNVLKMMAQAGGGECMQLGAKLSCLVSTPRVSLATITSADLVGPATLTAVQARRDRINGVTPRIRSEAHGWEVIPLDVIRGDTYLTEDGAERTREIDYQLVQAADQAAQLAAYDIANAREFGPATLPLKPVWMGYKPGDCLTCDIPELGLVDQDCIDLNREIDPSTGAVTLTLRSETADKHSWALGQAGTAPPTPSLTPPDFSVAAPGGTAWAVAAASLDGSSGEQIPVLRVTGAVDNTNAEAVFIEYRVDGTTDWQGAVLLSAGTTSYDISGVAPGTSYEVAVSYDVRGLKGDRLILGPVEAGTFGIFSEGASAPQLLADDKFLHQYWNLAAPAGRAIWPASRTGYAATVPFQSATNHRVYFDTTDSSKLPRSTAGKQLWVRLIANPAGFTDVQIVDDDGAAVIDTDGAYVYDAVTADFDLEVAIRWLNADGSFNSRSAIGTAAHGSGIQTIVGSATAPVTGFGVLEFGYPSQTGKAGAWVVYEPWEAEYEPAADVTALSQIVVSNATSVDVAADYTGTIASSALPRDVGPTVTKGGVDIRTATGTSYAVQNLIGGCVGNVSVNNTAGSADKGVQTIGTGFNASGSYELVVTVDGTAQPAVKVTVNKVVAAAPAGGGSSGGGGGSTTASGSFDASGTSVTSTSFVEIGRISNLAKTTGQTIRAYFSSDYQSGLGNAARTMSAKWQYSVAGANSWTDFAASVTGTEASYNQADHEYVIGSITCNQTATPANASYDLRLVALRTGSTGGVILNTGTASVLIGA
jgi:hypothetical protein